MGIITRTEFEEIFGSYEPTLKEWLWDYFVRNYQEMKKGLNMALAAETRVFLMVDRSENEELVEASTIRQGDYFKVEREGPRHVALLDAIVNQDGTISIPAEEYPPR